MDADAIKKLIDEGEFGKAGHACFDLAHKHGKGGAQTQDETQPTLPGGDSGGHGGGTQPPPPGGNG